MFCNLVPTAKLVSVPPFMMGSLSDTNAVSFFKILIAYLKKYIKRDLRLFLTNMEPDVSCPVFSPAASLSRVRYIMKLYSPPEITSLYFAPVQIIIATAHACTDKQI